jgi:hypothetical protein
MRKSFMIIAALLAVPAARGIAQQTTPPTEQQGRDAASIIREYYRGPGRAVAESRDELPANANAQLRVDAILSAELSRHMLPLPVDLTRLLPDLPRGQQRGRIGDRVVTVERSSQRIVEVVDITR